MIYQSILLAHLIGACATALAILYTLFVLHKRTAKLYRALALSLSGLAAFEVASGTALAVLSAEL